MKLPKHSPQIVPGGMMPAPGDTYNNLGIVGPLAEAIGYYGPPRPLTAAGVGGGAFTPNADFFAGRKGFAFDFTDARTLFQLSNGTTAVTSDNDPIGYATDLSGNARHATQATAGSRPLWSAGVAAVNGSRLMSIPAIDFSAETKVTVVACVLCNTAGNNAVYAHGTSLAGDFRLASLSGQGNRWVGTLQNNTGGQVFADISRSGLNASFKVVSMVVDLSEVTSALQVGGRYNGEANGSGVGTASAGFLSSKTGTLFSAFYGNAVLSCARIVVISGDVSVEELFNIEYWAGRGGGLTLIPEIPPPGEAFYTMINSYGQSLSCGVSTGGSILSSSARFNDVMPTGGIFVTTTGAAWTPLVETFRNISASDCYETPVSGFAEILHERGRANPIVGACAGVPSVTIAQCQQGQNIYNNLLTQASQGKRRARELFQQFKMRAVTWMQGEADGANGSYAADMATLIATLDTDIRAITLQSENVWLLSYQIARAKIGLAQLSASDSTPFIRVAMPMYFLDSYDTVHLTSPAYKVAGGYFGLAYKAIIEDGNTDWQPLKCLSSSVEGASVDLTFNPVGSLVFDTTIVAAQTNQGFRLFESDGTTPITISGVSIVGENVVRITSAGNIPASAIVRYGFSDPNNHTAGVDKGNLRDSQGDDIVFDGGGLNYPMHNWAVLQQVQLP